VCENISLRDVIVGGCSERECCFHGTSAPLEEWIFASRRIKLRGAIVDVKGRRRDSSASASGRLLVGRSACRAGHGRSLRADPASGLPAAGAYRGLRWSGIDSAARLKDHRSRRPGPRSASTTAPAAVAGDPHPPPDLTCFITRKRERTDQPSTDRCVDGWLLSAAQNEPRDGWPTAVLRAILSIATSQPQDLAKERT